MKKTIFKSLFVAVMALVAVACADKDFDDHKIQSIDNHGNDRPMVSVQVTAGSVSNFLALAVDPLLEETEYAMIPVVFNSVNPAPHDIHVTMVPDTAFLHKTNKSIFYDVDKVTGDTTYNESDYYVMPDASDPSAPAFTLVDDGVVVIPAGKSMGFLKIKTIANDYFGATAWAFAYKIASVKEGYAISGNTGSGCTALIPKNKYDGKYDLHIETIGWAAFNILDGNVALTHYDEYGVIALQTTGLHTDAVSNLVTGTFLQPCFGSAAASPTVVQGSVNAGVSQFGAATPVFTFDDSNILVNVSNSTPDDGRGRAFLINPAATATQNKWDPVTKNIEANYIMKQNGRVDQTIIMRMEYVGPR